MTRPGACRARAAVTCLLGIAVMAAGLSCKTGLKGLGLDAAAPAGRPPSIRPDNAAVTIPPNIAPLNFIIQEPGEEYLVRIEGCGTGIDVRTRSSKVRIPLKPWRALLEANRGGKITYTVYAGGPSGWTVFDGFEQTVASQSIDGYLCYRAIRPLYNYWRDVEVHQRDLSSFSRRILFDGRKIDEGCVNCHTFGANKPGRMSLGLRSSRHGDCTLVTQGKSVTRIDSKWGYSSWSPDGRLVALSLNKVRQFFHTGGDEVRDVVDLDSDIVVYDDETREVTTCPDLAEPNRMETYPCWSADGKALYFCSAPILWEDRKAMPPPRYDQVRYDLRRISYDPGAGKWGKAETVISAEDTGQCMMLPKTSPDGRFLLFCTTDYGCFPIYRPASDLCLLDLKTGEHRALSINSDKSESWHSWSSNSRWIAFSSKRLDGTFTRIYLSYIDETGEARKPFIVPQQDPVEDETLLRTFTFPELVTGPVPVSNRTLVRAARQGAAVALQMPETSMTPRAKTAETADPWQHGTKR